MTKGSLDFYFEYSSPYGYIASELIETMAERLNIDIVWKPFLMGAAFKVVGTRPLTEVPIKGEYAIKDLLRTARLHDIPYVHPPGFPLMPISACRATQWTKENHPEKQVELIHALYRYAFAEGQDFGKAETVVGIAEGIGLDGSSLRDGMRDAGLKERLRNDVQATIDRGIFGSPFFVYKDEPFWGVDHMGQLERWIKAGGW